MTDENDKTVEVLIKRTRNYILCTDFVRCFMQPGDIEISEKAYNDYLFYEEPKIINGTMSGAIFVPSNGYEPWPIARGPNPSWFDERDDR